MAGGIGHDARHLREADLIMPMEEIGADPGDGAAMVQGDRPKSPHMLAVGLLVFIHET